MRIDEFREATKGKSVEDFTQKVKKLPVYSTYKKEVEMGKSDTEKKLQALVMLLSLADEELSALMTSVAFDLLFAMVDARLRNEILKSEDNTNV